MTIRIGLVAESYFDKPHGYQRVGDKYIDAVMQTTEAVPLILPLQADLDAMTLAACVDGIIFPGGYSNVDRRHYGMEKAPAGEHEDPARDRFSMRLMKDLVAIGMPLLGVCRGFQELNVAYGGSLHPRLHEVEGRQDHREDKSAALGLQYGPAHRVDVRPAGLLARIVGEAPFEVNSLHMQGIDILAPSLRIEATAADGTIEAVSVKDAPGFALAVQWHPEWNAQNIPQSVAIFRYMYKAAQAFSLRKSSGGHQPTTAFQGQSEQVL